MMQPSPKVTIITPSFNQAAFLEQTICSVLDQHYPNLEYFVVDGGSTDGIVEIIRKYSDQIAWWVSERDRGQAEAINKGFARATGEIIGWLNSDDIYLPGCIQAAVDVFQTDPGLVMVYGDMLSVDGSGETINLQKFGNWGLKGLMRFQIIGQPAVFMRRSALEKAGFLDINFHFMLDHHLWLRVAQQGSTRHTPQIWAAARYHEGAGSVGMDENPTKTEITL
jgi:glycosyltransferase involved in cell wall biosynthesis